MTSRCDGFALAARPWLCSAAGGCHTIRGASCRGAAHGPATLILNRVLPTFLLLGLGAWTRRAGFLSDRTVADRRRIAVSIALPFIIWLYLPAGMDDARRHVNTTLMLHTAMSLRVVVACFAARLALAP